MNERMNVSVYYETSTIYLNNIAAIIFQKTINLLCQDPGKCSQLPQCYSRGISFDETITANACTLIAMLKAAIASDSRRKSIVDERGKRLHRK